MERLYDTILSSVPRSSRQNTRQVYNEHKPRLAVSGWFHGALASEMQDWPEHTLDVKAKGETDGGATGAASTLEQLKGGTGHGAGDGDVDASGVFIDDFAGAEVRKHCLKR